MTRRDFLKAAALTAAAMGTTPKAFAEDAQAPAFKTVLHKALIAKVADDATCERIAKAGFKGVELYDKAVTVKQAEEGRLTAEKHGIKIHSYMVGWAEFNSPDEAKRNASIEDVRRLIHVANAYGVPTVLLVPCRVGGMAMPKPSQFAIDFDPGTLMVKSVVAGDNTPYADYIRAQNAATQKSIEAVNSLIPTAAEEGVTICLENVWNNLWVLPKFASAFVRSFNDPWVKAYLDLGNHVRYAFVEEWVSAMAGITAKMHIKDFKIDRSKPNDGTFVPIGKGSIDFQSVRRAIEAANYNGWVSIESEGWTDAEHSAIMDRFFAGKPVLG
jgi:L-ribulose-5-phosphate 3-epimerase